MDQSRGRSLVGVDDDLELPVREYLDPDDVQGGDDVVGTLVVDLLDGCCSTSQTIHHNESVPSFYLIA